MAGNAFLLSIIYLSVGLVVEVRAARTTPRAS